MFVKNTNMLINFQLIKLFVEKCNLCLPLNHIKPDAGLLESQLIF